MDSVEASPAPDESTRAPHSVILNQVTWSSKTINGPLNDASKPPTSLRARVRISTDEGPAVLSSLSRILGIHAPGARTPCVSVMGWICLAPSAYQFIAGAATIADFRMRRQDGDLRVQLVREPDVVGVEERDELALGVRDPQVAGRAHPLVDMTLVLQIDDLPGQPLGVRPRDRRAAIRRSIVDEKELPVVKVCARTLSTASERNFSAFRKMMTMDTTGTLATMGLSEFRSRRRRGIDMGLPGYPGSGTALRVQRLRPSIIRDSRSRVPGR